MRCSCLFRKQPSTLLHELAEERAVRALKAQAPAIRARVPHHVHQVVLPQPPVLRQKHFANGRSGGHWWRRRRRRHGGRRGHGRHGRRRNGGVAGNDRRIVARRTTRYPPVLGGGHDGGLLDHGAMRRHEGGGADGSSPLLGAVAIVGLVAVVLPPLLQRPLDVSEETRDNLVVLGLLEVALNLTLVLEASSANLAVTSGYSGST